MRICIIFFLLILPVFNHPLHAQEFSTSTLYEEIPVNGGAGGVPELQEKVSYTVLPSKPRVGDLVKIQAEMYGTPVQNAIFIWTLNGKEYSKGQGVSDISFYVQKNTNISLTIITVRGSRIVKDWTFNPQNVLILWESNTYTPPFYKGKSLYTPEARLVFHGLNLDQKNPLTSSYANYVWKVDGKVKGNESGVAKRTYTYQGNILQQEPLFELLYSNITNYQQTTKIESTQTRALARVQTLQTDIFTFEKTPLLGVLFNSTVQNTFSAIKDESTLVTYPIYFSINSSLDSKNSWFINNDLIKSNVNTVTFKKTVDNQKSILDITIKNPKSLLQTKNKSYIIDTTSTSTEALSTSERFGN